MIGESLWIYAAAGMHFLSKRLLAPSEVSGALIFLPLPCLFFSPASAPRQQSPIAVLCSSCRWVSQFIPSVCDWLSRGPISFLGGEWNFIFRNEIPAWKHTKPGHVGHAAFQPFLFCASPAVTSSVITAGRHSIWAKKSFVSSTVVRPEAW